jgi:hypothetical protein
MNRSPCVSIIINNYNYGRFLRAAVDSALAQAYPRLEVIVVDDGSTDDSPRIIETYGPRIVPVLQENGGQARAMNTGFAHSRGSYVIFLDADDVLDPQLAAQVVDRFRRDPQIVRIQYRLAVIDAGGAPTGEVTPPVRRPLPNGDLSRAALAYGDDIAWLPTSGNAFAADRLRQIFPIPGAPYRICADYYLSNLSPLLGRVAALDIIGGYYRVHTANRHHTTLLDPEQTRQNIVRTAYTHTQLQTTAQRLGRPGDTEGGVARLSVMFPANRLVSLRLDPARHPLPDDTRPALAQRGIRAAWRRPGLSFWVRLLFSSWFLAVAFAPDARVVRWLAERLFYPAAHRRGSGRALIHRRGVAE